MTSTSDNAVLRPLGETDQTVVTDDEDIRGRAVKDSDGDDLGHVADLLIDEREHKVRFMVVKHGGFLGLGRKKTIIPIDDITGIDSGHVQINHAKGHVANGPEYDPELMNDPVHLGSVYGHYQSAPYWGAEYGYAGYPYFPAMRSSR